MITNTCRYAFVSLAVVLLVTTVVVIRAPTSAAASGAGVVYSVDPTGDPAQDIPNVQAAIDNANDGDTVVLKAGTFNFGDWRTNPIPGGFVVINKGVTVKGDGFDDSGNPRTIIQGGGYRQKNHWEYCEWGVITFSGDASGGVLEEIWLKEPHFYAVFTSGFCGQNHENITIRNVKITDISQDIPEWYQVISTGRSIDMGGNVPEWGLGGSSGTVTIEGCDISNTGSTVDLDYIDPDTGALYYKDPDGNDLFAHDSQAIGLWINTAADLIVRNNRLEVQNEGIVTEAIGGTGQVIISSNDISVQTVALSEHVRRGYRFDAWDAALEPAIPFQRTVRVVRNRIRVVGEPEEDVFTAGILMGADSGGPEYNGRIVVKGNSIEMQGGDGALVLGLDRDDGCEAWLSVLNAAVIKHNRIGGTARFGVLSKHGARNCRIFANPMSGFEPSVAHVGFYGPETHDNVAIAIGRSGVYVEADGAYNNRFIGFEPK